VTDLDDLCRRFENLGTSTVSDALDKLRIAGQCLGLRPLAPTMRLVGVAFTVRYVPVGARGGSVGDFIDDLRPGQVPVLDNAGRMDATVWGDLLTATADQKGLPGTVIDGVCRDTDLSLRLNYPIFSRGAWMRTGKDRVRAEAYEQAVSIGGVTVEPGDLLVGDADGVLAVPAARADEVCRLATAIGDAEDRIRAAVQAGSSLARARADHGYHALQSVSAD
jgi:regulator of RNase E activity RraA